MNPFEFVLALVVITTLITYTYRYLVERMRHAEQARNREDDTGNAELVRRIDMLEERVRVLERIVTDESSNLRDRFSEL